MEQPPDLLRIVQEENKKWTEHNFPGQLTHVPVLGVTEELGELYEARTPEARLDAAADILIFAASYCNHHGFDLQAIWDTRPDAIDHYAPHSTQFLRTLGRIAHHQLKCEQRIRGDRHHHLAHLRVHLANLLALLHDYLSNHNSDLEELAFKVWREEVQPRVWRKPEGAST